jgi:cobalamin synthase
MRASTRSAARVLQVDAGLDGAIAVLFLVLAATGPVGAWARPDWLAGPALLCAAAVLVVFAAGLLVLARRPDAQALRAFGVGNGVTAVVIAIWAVLDPAVGFALRPVLLVVAAALAAVAVAQVRTARS